MNTVQDPEAFMRGMKALGDALVDWSREFFSKVREAFARVGEALRRAYPALHRTARDLSPEQGRARFHALRQRRREERRRFQAWQREAVRARRDRL